LILLR
jgi:hypothetical protein